MDSGTEKSSNSKDITKTQCLTSLIVWLHFLGIDFFLGRLPPLLILRWPMAIPRLFHLPFCSY